jgi:hypothetical protein
MGEWGGGALGSRGARRESVVNRVALLIGLMICLGCSSLSTIFIRNESGRAIDVSVTYIAGGRREVWSGMIADKQRAEAIKFGQAPDKIWISVDGETTYLPFWKLPPELKQTGSSGDPFEWVFDGKRGKFRSADMGPAAFLRGNLMGLWFAFWGVLCWVSSSFGNKFKRAFAT